jgi:hypothetical protein
MPRRVIKKHRPDANSRPFLTFNGDRTPPPWDGPVDVWVDDVDADWDDIVVSESRPPRTSEPVATDT